MDRERQEETGPGTAAAAGSGDAAAPRREGPAGRRALISWCLYDWASSPHPTLIITFVFATYFTQAVASDPERGTALWGWAMSLSGLAIALLAPLLGAIADRSGARKPWLLVLTVLTAMTASLLWFVEPDPRFILLALVLAGLTNLSFEFSQVFYNAMLPELAPPGKVGRISGWGWGVGYFGGIACLSLALVLLVLPDPPLFGLAADMAEPIRMVGPLVAAWFLLFAIPLFLYVPDRPASGIPAGEAIRRGASTLIGTLRQVRRHRTILHFLLAKMLYVDGLNTLFAFGGIYAAGTFGMSTQGSALRNRPSSARR